ncbi:uncharacterized protein LOC129745707 isoform X2 [Uranotaenia lowii]|uniref:uncharacterized protein LOC129745707 isoform X2 n=1 Tax=Uranotaenia lowii TaxID=190385 RepID=UPI0024796F80|nr:uncharacterized protein LOC129745707 isoform X2 [Uranotaenia lowii]
MDSKTLHIIQGEASETDEELEINDSNVIKIESGPDAPPPISIQRKLSVEALDTSPCCFEEDMHLSELKNMIIPNNHAIAQLPERTRLRKYYYISQGFQSLSLETPGTIYVGHNFNNRKNYNEFDVLLTPYREQIVI